MVKRLFSLVLALVLCLGVTPLRAAASPAETEDGPVKVTFHAPEETEARGEAAAAAPKETDAELTGLVSTDPMYFNYVNLSNAGAAQIDDWVSGEYPGAREQLGDGEHGMDADFLKTRLMVRAMNFNTWDYQEPIEYFIPWSDQGSRHELTLYGYEDLEPADIEVLGVRLLGSIEKHVYGDVDSTGMDERLYWYTVPVFVPMNDTALDIHVKGEPFAVIPLTHIGGACPVALVSTMQVYDYEEGASPDTLRSMTLRYSGFNLPTNPAAYVYVWREYLEGETEDDPWEEVAHEVPASEVSDPDENGYRLVRFDFGGDTDSSGMIWGDLYFKQSGLTYTQYFFDKATHLAHNSDEELLYDANGRPYFRTNYDLGDGGAPYGTNTTVPTPYYCIFKEPSFGEAPEVMPTLSGDYYNEALGMSRTYLPHIWLTVHPGSYEGGEVVFSDDIGGTGYERATGIRDGMKQMTYLRKNNETDYGVKHIRATFSKEGLRTVTVTLAVEYIPEKAPTPTNPGCADPATGQEIERTEGGISIGGAAERVYRFYVSGPKAVTMYLMFYYTEAQSGNVYQTGNTLEMAWNEETGRYELDVERGAIPPEAEIVRFQILNDYNGGYRYYGDPADAALWNPEPGFRLDIDNVTEETTFDTVGAILYPKDYKGGTVAVSLDGGQTWGAELRPDSEEWPAVYFTLPAPGDYQVFLRFTKAGLNPFVAGPRHVFFDDGSAPPPADAGVELDGEPVRQKNGAWVISGRDEAQFTFFALADQGQALEAVFRDAQGADLFTRDLAWAAQRYETKARLSELRRAATVSFRVKAGEDGKPGRARTLDLRVLYLKALYAPTVPYELKQDAEGKRFFAVAPGAVFSGVFEAPALQGLTQGVTLSYQTAAGAAKTAQGTVQGDDKGQFTVSLTLPEDADRLVSIRYALSENGETLAEVSYPLTDWRVWAQTLVTGIPKAYADAGAVFTLKGGNTDFYAVLTADNYAALDLGDLPTGTYTYEIAGRSGHILGGTASITRGQNLTLSDCPALGSLTVTAAGEEVAALLNLSLVTPDGASGTAVGAVGGTMYDLPLGTTATVTPEYDANAYPEIIGYTPTNQTITVNGNETVTFTFQKASFRTVSGKLVRADHSRYQHVYYTDVAVEQTVMRNGRQETYRATVRTDFNGNFKDLRVYEGIEATLTVRHVTYQLVNPCVFTPSGDTDLGELEVSFSTELVVPVRLILATPAHVGEDGQPYRDDNGNLRGGEEGEVLAESAVLPTVSYVYMYANGNKTLKNGVDFDVFTMNGNQVLRFHEGTVQPGATLKASFGRQQFEYGGRTYGFGYTTAEVVLDEHGSAVMEVHAGRVGGELRATVAPEDSGLVGMLRIGTRVVYGVGELSMSYGPEEQNGVVVYAMTVRPEEAEELAEHFRTGGNPGSSAVSRYLKNQLRDNRVLYLDRMTPAQPVGADIFGPYRLSYETQLSTTKGHVIVKGTLTKRYPGTPDEFVIDQIDLNNGGWPTTRYCDYAVNDEWINAGEPDFAGDRSWHNTQDADGFYRPTEQLRFYTEVPLDDANHYTVGLRLYTRSLTGTDAEGRAVYSPNRGQQGLGIDETANIFDLSVPDMLFIREEQEAQKKDDWTARISLRTFISELPAENEITIWDNGVAIDTFTVSSNRYDSTLFIRNVRLTNNQSAGLHTLWATRQVLGDDGEYGTMISYSQCLPVLLGNEHDRTIHIGNIQWTHWNHRRSWDPNEPDYMFFSSPADLEGEEIWIWPDKRSDMWFNVENADQRVLEGVNFVYTAQVLHEGWDWYDNMGNHGNKWLSYWTTATITIPCNCYYEGTRADGTVYSRWGFENKYLGYITGFSWQFVYKAEIDTSNDPDLGERVEKELEALYEANGLGEVPDDAALAGDINKAGDDLLLAELETDADLLPDMFWDLKPAVTEETEDRIVLTAPDTAEVEGFRIEMREGELITGAKNLNEQIYELMETERENGSQDPNEKPEDGWRVYWAKTDSLQGATLTRMAVLEKQEADGRYHYSYHRRVYLPVRVAEALTGATLLDEAELMDAHDDFIERADRGKKVYDTFNDYFTYADLGNTMYVNQMEKEMRIFMGSAEAGEKWGKECSFISDRAGKTMAVLGVADTAYSFYKGPDGKDGSGLRQLLEHVQDERFKAGIERQIKDYEEMRQAIFNQDMTMKTVSSASNFANINIIGKLAVFLGGLGNSYLSDRSKEFNQQVYDTTLLDIQRQIRFEKAKASRPAAEQWLRDRMDRIYGKGHWSEYALEEERKYWVLVTDEDGCVRYVWHEKAGNYKAVWDPSGFVYEAVEDQRLEGVTATIYYSETEDGSYSVWNDTSGQPNPTWTASEGQYGWMVPSGWWKVRYEKDGYRIAESKPMNVPPIHTTVNIGLLRTEAPTLRVSVGAKEITVAFSQYMQLESLIRLFGGESYRAASFDGSAFTVQFYDKNGVSIPGTVSFPDKAANTGYKGEGYGRDVIASDWFVRSAVFTPADPDADLSGATWVLADGMVSYAGVALDKSGSAAGLRLIRFEPDGGVLRTQSMVTDESGKLASLPTPTREGYDFDGWRMEDGSSVSEGRVFTADATLRAAWSEATGAEVLSGEGASVFRVRLENYFEAAACAVAAYDENGKFLKLSLQSLTDGAAEVSLNLSGLRAAWVRCFFLDGSDNPVYQELRYFVG